jgi:hypothetical protein
VLYGPETLEALACFEVVGLAEDLLLHKIATTSDCRAIVKNFQASSVIPYVHILMEIQEKEKAFQEVHFVHENMNSNKDAHIMGVSPGCEARS